MYNFVFIIFLLTSNNIIYYLFYDSNTISLFINFVKFAPT